MDLCHGNIDEAIELEELIRSLKQLNIEVSIRDERAIEDEIGTRYFSMALFIEAAGLDK